MDKKSWISGKLSEVGVEHNIDAPLEELEKMYLANAKAPLEYPGEKKVVRKEEPQQEDGHAGEAVAEEPQNEDVSIEEITF